MTGRPFGAFPDWAADATITTTTPPTEGFTPATADPDLANWAFRHGIRDWAIARDAIELLNWTPAKTVSINNTAVGADCFSYDPVRKWWFFGGLHHVDVTLGMLSYSPDNGNNWIQIDNAVLPYRHTTGDTAYYQQAVSDDGRYFTWLTSGQGLTVFPTFAFLNSNTGPAGWTASANQPPGVIQHAFWAQADNRFIAVGITAGLDVTAWSVDVDTDTWDVLALPGAAISSSVFGAASPGDRVVANQNQIWRSSSVASAFEAGSPPWSTLTALAYVPGARAFVALADGKLWASGNGVAWAQAVTGFEGTGAFGGAVNGLGDAVVATFTPTNPDGITSNTLIVGTNALRDWRMIQSPQNQPNFGIYPAGDRLVMLNTANNCAIRASMGIS